jgi:hypothetical protein
MGALGPALMFLCFLALAAVLGLCLLVYAARCLLVIIEGTAGGADRIQWPDDGYIDWIGQSFGLIGLTILLLVPAGILTAVLGWPTLILAGPLLWLFFPIGALSSLSAGQRLMFFRPAVVSRMVKLLPWTLLLYLASPVVLALAVGPWYLAVFGGKPMLLALAAPLSAAMVLIYGRLLGQLAFRIVQLGPLTNNGRATRHQRGSPADSEAPLRPDIAMPGPARVEKANPLGHIPQSPTGLLDMDNLAPYELADPTGPILAREVDPPKRLRPLDPEEEDARLGYAMAEPHLPNPKMNTDALLRTLPRTIQDKMATENAPQLAPTLASVICFPIYDTSLSALVWLSCGNGLLGLVVMQLLSFGSQLS